MARYDLSDEELVRYRSSVVPPEDLSDFWERTLSEARAVSWAPKLERVDTGCVLSRPSTSPSAASAASRSRLGCTSRLAPAASCPWSSTTPVTAAGGLYLIRLGSGRWPVMPVWRWTTVGKAPWGAIPGILQIPVGPGRHSPGI